MTDVSLKEYFEKILEEKDKALAAALVAVKEENRKTEAAAEKRLPFNESTVYPGGCLVSVPGFMSLEGLRYSLTTLLGHAIVVPVAVNAKSKEVIPVVRVGLALNLGPLKPFRVKSGAAFALTPIGFPKVVFQPYVNSFIASILTLPHRIMRASKLTSAHLPLTFIGAVPNILSQITRPKPHSFATSSADSFRLFHYLEYSICRA